MATRYQNAVWFIGKNGCSECGEIPDDNDSNNSNDDNNICKELTLCQWSTKMRKNIIKILRADAMNIYIIPTKDDEYITYGFIRECQQLLPHFMNQFFIIPSDVILLCLQFFGNNYNEYWTLGFNSYGQCGVNHMNSVKNIQQTKNMNNIQKVCAGINGGSVIWIKNNGEIYLTGNNKYGQLGIITNTDRVSTPILLTYFKDKGLKCIEATTSITYNMIVCNDGSVWSSGTAFNGENGHNGNPRESNNFLKIKALSTYKIINVAISSGHTLFLEENGNVWSCGHNSCGELGIGTVDDDDIGSPVRIKYFINNKITIKKIECGSDHNIVLDNNGKIYCWGYNDNAQCGMDNDIKSLVTVPTINKYLNMETIIDIKAGTDHTGCVTNHQFFYLWGFNKYNQCCLTQNDIDIMNKTSIFIPNCINQYIFNVTKCKLIIDMTLGDDTTMFLLSNQKK